MEICPLHTRDFEPPRVGIRRCKVKLGVVYLEDGTGKPTGFYKVSEFTTRKSFGIGFGVQDICEFNVVKDGEEVNETRLSEKVDSVAPWEILIEHIRQQVTIKYLR